VGSSFKDDHGSYRYNGYHETKNTPAKRSRYWPKTDLARAEQFGKNLLDEQQLGAAVGVKKKPEDFWKDPLAWDFDRGPKGRNYKSANRPFVHMYHHMVPWEVLSETYDLDELKMFQIAGYNLNAGFNLIILPCTTQPAMILGMYTHPNDHPDYTVSLISLLRQMKAKLKKQNKQAHLTQEQVNGIKDSLESWEKAEWYKIQVAGKLANAAHINTYRPSAVPANNAAVGSS
jgi:phage regulator Rha-like protein